LRRAGLAGSLDHLRAGVFNDLLQNRNPFDRLAPVPEAPAAHDAPAADDTPAADDGPDEEDAPAGDHAPAVDPTSKAGRTPAGDPAPGTDRTPARDPAPGTDRTPAGDPAPPDDPSAQDAPVPESPSDGWDCLDDPIADEREDADGDAPIGAWPRSGDDRGPEQDLGYDEDSAAPSGAGGPARAPTPAVINLVVHAGTLFGWDTTPSQAGGWGLLNPAETKDLVAAASTHPQTRWCMTVIGPDGTAVAHGCSPGRHPWSPAPPDAEAAPPQSLRDGPYARKAEQFFELMRALNLKFEPIAQGTCDHRHAEDRYTPSRTLQHLVRARSGTCTAPGCQAQAAHADLDHTTPYPEGATDECNLGPKCRTHHRAKQTPGWNVEQPEPGVFRWTLPSGRNHTTRPSTY
jgi:hypothetical protein